MSTQIENPGMPCGTTLWLGVEETTQLFSVLLQSHMTMNELLLAVITYAYVKWSGQPYLYITTNDPGRTLLEHVDVSRTIAFLNINKIFCLQAKEEAFLDVLASVQDQIQRMPTQGYGWELLNLYGDPSRVPPRILATRTANVNLVYFGVVSTNQVNADDDLWKPSYYYQDSVLPKADLTVADLQGQEENFLGIGCQSMVLHNRWKIALQYHKNIYQREDIEEFAEICMQAIQEFYRNYL